MIDSFDSGTTTFAHDAAGNIVRRTDATGVVTEYAYDALSRLTATRYPQTPTRDVSFSYDDTDVANGIGRLTQVHDADDVVAGYRGRRILKGTPGRNGRPGTRTIYVYGPNGALLGEYDLRGRAKREYLYLDGTPVAQIDAARGGEAITYLYTDHLGTPRLGTDATGTVVWRLLVAT